MKNKKKYKNLIKKIKKTNKYQRYFFIISLLTYLLSILSLSYNLVLLNGIETLIRVLIIILLLIILFIYTLISLLTLISKKKKTLIIIQIIFIIFSSINILISYYINKTYNIVDDIKKEKIIYTTNYISLKDNNNLSKIGLINNEEDIEGYILPQEYLVKNNIKSKIINYDNYNDLLYALYNKEVDRIFIESNYILKYSEYETFQNISEDTILIDKYSKKMNNKDLIESTNKSVTEPFSILLLGVDSEYDGLENNSSFNGDSIMLATFNPKTLSATLFSIPRDTYVPIACNNNKSFKINSAAGYGTKCMIDTIENLVDIDIDYYVKINFKGVVSLVDSLGGITLNIDKPDYKYNGKINCGDKICEQDSNRQIGANIIFITPGENQTLNGEQALAYSRNRHQFAASDFKRIEHQQAVVTAILNKTKNIRNLNTLYKVLNAVSNNIDTNMETKEILNFYNVAKKIILNSSLNESSFINIQKTYLTGYDLNLYQNGSNIYTFQYYDESLNEITNAMKENLEIKKPELIKNFSFSTNKLYEIPIIGKTYSNIKKNETLPNFVGSNINYLNSWIENRNISIITNYEMNNNCTENTILSQNVHNGTLVSSITSLTVNICKNSEEIYEDNNN